MLPSVWGPAFWATIHFAALGYPDTPTPQDRADYETFYKNLHKILPCIKCAEHYKQHLIALPMTNALQNSEELFAWTVMMHNKVNKDLGKPEWPLERAVKHYKDLVESKAMTPSESTHVKAATFNMGVSIVILVLILIMVMCAFYRTIKSSFKK